MPAVQEQAILEALRQVPGDRWEEVLRYLKSLQAEPEPIRTGADLARSDLVGLWSSRTDLGDSQEFARGLRRQAELRGGSGDAARH